MTTTIGQKILSAIISHQLGISADRALKLYVQGRELDPSWEQTGEMLLHEYLRALQAPAEKTNCSTLPSGASIHVVPEIGE